MPTRRLEEDYASHGFSGRLGLGQRPALLVVDFVKGYVDPSSPLCAAPGVPDAIEATVPLLAAAREAAIEIIFTQVRFAPDGSDGGLFVKKIPALMNLAGDSPYADIVDALAPREGEIVLVKKYASAFFGTPLSSVLVSSRLDTLILTGCSTSGCVRATAVDGLQHGWPVTIPRECVGDRAPEIHEASLFDLNGKYADVVGRDEVLDYLRTLRS